MLAYSPLPLSGQPVKADGCPPTVQFYSRFLPEFCLAAVAKCLYSKWEPQCRPALSEKFPEITSVVIRWNIYDLDGDDDDDDGLVG